MPRAVDPKPWLEQAVAAMVKTGCPLAKAAADLDPPQHLSEVDVDNLLRRTEVHQMIRRFRREFYAEMAREGTPSKEQAVAKMWALVHELSDRGDADKALNGIKEIAKLEKWVDPDQVVNNWMPTPAQMAEIRSRIEKAKAAAATDPPDTVQ